MSAEDCLRILQRYRRIAMVGLSANPMRPSHFAAIYMLSQGYEIIPVNPREKWILGRACYPSVREAPAPVEIVDIFRETLQDGAVLLLCSDGLWEMVPDERQLMDVLSLSWASAEHMAERLVQLALAAGGRDNIGLVVVRVRIEDISGLQTIINPLAGARMTV